MAKLTFVGDTHGAWLHLHRLINKANRKFQPELIVHVGDVGFGWHKKDPERRFVETFRFLRGNHDMPQWCREHPSYLGDYGYLEKYRLFFMSGAESIDQRMRVENIDWWRDEQLSMQELQAAIDLCVEKKPEIIVTHDAPISLYNDLTQGRFFTNGEGSNRTADALQVMFEAWQPKWWVFGHHHRLLRKEVNGTKFICVPVAQMLNLDTSKNIDSKVDYTL